MWNVFSLMSSFCYFCDYSVFSLLDLDLVSLSAEVHMLLDNKEMGRRLIFKSVTGNRKCVSRIYSQCKKKVQPFKYFGSIYKKS